MRAYLEQAWRRKASESDEAPFRDELLGAQRLEDRALTLAERFTINPRARATNILPRFAENARVLRHAYRTLASDVRAGRFLTSGAEWLLDNFHLVASQIADAHRNLPRTYYRQLPPLASPEYLGRARVYAMAIELVRHSDGRFERKQLEQFLNSYQRVAPLTIGELWAWPSMLTLALVENLRRLADEILRSRRARTIADDYLLRAETDRPVAWPASIHVASVVQLLLRAREYGPEIPLLRRAVQAHLDARQITAEEAVRSEHQRQGVTQVSVANAITSLRLCSEVDWREYFERVSLVEHALRRDPAGVYGRMDFLSRDQQRHAVEEIADPSGEAQVQLALKAVDSARQAAAAGTVGDRAAHVGYHLVGPGRPDLEADVAYRAPARTRVRRLVLGHPTLLYLGSIAAVSALLLAAAVRWMPGIDDSLLRLVFTLALLAVPALDLAGAFVQRLLARAIGPRRLPRLDFTDGVPDDARTMVIVPTLLASPEAVAALLEHLEVLAHGNLDPRIHFAILSDFVDAPSAERDGDAAILSAACEGILDLNVRFGRGHADRFFLFHRERRWNPRERVWMGWERKRGKIDEFNRLLRGATKADTTFTTKVGDLDVLPSVRYCLTLDTDTRLPRDAAKSLIGIIAHPLNRPRFDARAGRVTEGYGILQPRVSVTMASAAGSLFARLYAGHTGVDPYTTAVSDTYQDLFDEGIFTGKGLYDVDAFVAALRDRVPENTLLSHDLLRGVVRADGARHRRRSRRRLPVERARAREAPAPVGARRLADSVVAAARRAGPCRLAAQSTAAHRALEDLRQSAAQPDGAGDAWRCSWPGGPCCPDRRSPGRRSASRRWRFPSATRSWRYSAPSGRRARWRATLDDLRMAAGAQRVAGASSSPARPTTALHAIVVTLVRVGFTHRRLLEWETAAATVHRAGPPRLGAFAIRMMASPILAAAIVAGVAAIDARALIAALPLAVVGGGARDRVPPQPPGALAPRGARRPGPGVPACRGAEDVAATSTPSWGRPTHALPPDNVQLTPDLRVAHRTSPTNIAMALLATVSAHDLGFIDLDEMAARLDATLDDGRGPRALRGAPVQLVRHGHARAASARVRLHGGQRQSRRRARHPGRRPAATGPRGCPGDAPRFGCAISRPEPARSSTRWTSGRSTTRAASCSASGYRLASADGEGRLDTSALRPAGVRGAAGELSRDQQGRCARIALVPPRASRDGRARRAGAAVVERHALRVPDAAAPDAHVSRARCSMSPAAWRSSARSTTARKLGVPWGISESAYSAVDRHGTYQYKAFGVPGLGLKRGLGDELVVAPYASALAAMLVPAQSASNLRRLAALGLEGDYGFFDAVDYTDRGQGAARRAGGHGQPGHRAHLHGAPPGHDARRAGQRARSTTAWSRGSTWTPACRRPNSCCRNGCRATCPRASARWSTTCA